MKRLLMIVDPQIDFITGALPVDGARKSMDNLAEHIALNGAMYSSIIVTADRHPFNHCSFSVNGGQWVRHCVHDTVGAAIWQRIMNELYRFNGHVSFLYKGESPDVEEYSIFKNQTAAAAIDKILGNNNDIVDICGLAGDICVSDTIEDRVGLYGADRFNVLVRFSPSIDGGKRLYNIIRKYNLSCDR